MVFNETLEKHRECLRQCEIEREDCEREQDNATTCDLEMQTCERDCDFDYGP